MRKGAAEAGPKAGRKRPPYNTTAQNEVKRKFGNVVLVGDGLANHGAVNVLDQTHPYMTASGREFPP
jgi:hypothetical protein